MKVKSRCFLLRQFKKAPDKNQPKQIKPLEFANVYL